jgi:hypothetical protein
MEICRKCPLLPACVTIHLVVVLQLILHRAGCLVQPTRIDFDSRELATMIRVAGVNRIIQFTGVLRGHLEDARKGVVEPGLLALLKKSRQVTYAGMPLATELEDWAVAQGIPVTVNCLFHSIVYEFILPSEQLWLH